MGDAVGEAVGVTVGVAVGVLVGVAVGVMVGDPSTGTSSITVCSVAPDPLQLNVYVSVVVAFGT